MTKEKNPWKKLSEKVHYENPWIKVREDQVLNPAGNPGIYGVVMVKHIAVGVIPMDADGYLYLVGQYRYPLEKYSWEIPEGGASFSEQPLEAAKRELKEETGIEAATYTPLIELDLSNCISDERAIIFLATDFLKIGADNQDETENLQLKKIHREEVFKMVLNGEIRDAMSVAALLKLKIFIENGTI